MKIGELANTVGVTPKTIRFYEEEGLLREPSRTESGYRNYTHEDVDRLSFVLKAKHIGMSLQEIRSVLEVHDRSDPTCIHVRALVDQKLAQVDRAIRDLQEFRSELAALRDRAGVMDDCRPSGGNICGIVERSELHIDPESLHWMRTAGPKR